MKILNEIESSDLKTVYSWKGWRILEKLLNLRCGALNHCNSNAARFFEYNRFDSL